MNLQWFGIIERPGYQFEKRVDPGYTIIGTDLESNAKDVYIALKNPSDYKTSITQILRSIRL